MYTDGVTEAMNSAQLLVTDEQLVDCLQRTNGSSLKEMLETTQSSLMEFAAGFPQSDDITMLTLRYVGKE